jgi:hypothetical protein
LKLPSYPTRRRTISLIPDPPTLLVTAGHFKNSDTISPDSKLHGQRRPIRELSEQERRRYARWWKKYVTLKRAAQIGILVCVLCGVFSFSRHELSYLTRPIFYTAFWMTVICEKFSGWWGSEWDDWGTSECQQCELNCHDLSALSGR